MTNYAFLEPLYFSIKFGVECFILEFTVKEGERDKEIEREKKERKREREREREREDRNGGIHN